MNLRELNKIFEKNKNFLEKAKWYISDPLSFKWWGNAENAEEVFISAILVQRSKWEIVERILKKLKKKRLINLKKLAKIEYDKLEEILKPIGLRKVKAARIINSARKITEINGLERLREYKNVRKFLLSLEGIGKETADSIMLFALNIPTFPVSNYVKRVLNRIGFTSEMSYEKLRNKIVRELNKDLYELKLLYAGITSVGRIACKREPICKICILKETCKFSNFSLI